MNRATHSCPPYSPSASDPPFTQYNNISYPTSLCLPSSTTSTLWCHPTESAQSTTPSPTRSKAKPASASTEEKPACGTQLASNHRTSGTSGKMCGLANVGNPNLPATSQGMTVLGAPIGSAAFVQHQLQHANQHHQHILDRIPQASWLLLLYCASPRCTYLLRMCSPNVTTEFANNHDFAVAACLRRLLEVEDLPAQALTIAHRPLSQGGLGLTCASVLATPAFWSSWADSLPVNHNQLPQYAGQIWSSSNTPPQLSPVSKQ